MEFSTVFVFLRKSIGETNGLVFVRVEGDNRGARASRYQYDMEEIIR